LADYKNNLIYELKSKGIKDEKILNVISRIPREIFLSKNLKEDAYLDKALPIDCGQTISQPYTLAFMTELLEIDKGDKVLEIGTGSGYQAIVLYMLGAKVYTVERHDALFRKAVKIFRKYDLVINTRIGDGTLGWNENAPYDKIIVTAAAPNISNILKSQLAIGGKMVVPVGDKNSQTMFLVEKIEENKFKSYKKGSFKFVPLIGKDGWSEEE